MFKVPSRLISVCVLSTLLFCVPFLPMGPFEKSDSEDQTNPVITYSNDLYEPNDSTNTATLFTTDSLINLICIPGEKDWYKIPVDSNLQTTFFFQAKINSSGYEDCSFSLLDKNFHLLRSKNISSAIPVSMTFFSKTCDTFYILIYKPLYNVPEVRYDLRIYKSTEKMNDSTEPNNSKLTASILANTTTVAFLPTESDTDYYKIFLAAKGYLTLSVIDDSVNVNSVTSRLITSQSARISGSALGNVTSYTYFSNLADTCYLKISSSRADTSTSFPSRYALSMTKITILNDTYEPNDTKHTSKAIGRGFYDSLKVVGTEDDYYKVSFDTLMYVEAVLRRIPAAGSSQITMDVESIDSTLNSASCYSDYVKLSFIVSERDSMYLHINGVSLPSIPLASLYSLELRATPVSKIDSLEPNNTVSMAVPITTQSVQSILFGQNDTDYYKIAVKKGEDALITVKDECISGNGICSKLQQSNGLPVNSSTSYGYIATYGYTYLSVYNYNSPINDTLVLKVYSQYSSSNSVTQFEYSITKTSLLEDRYEPNNAQVLGALLKTGFYDSLYSNVSNNDCYKFTSDTAVVLEVTLNTPTMSSSNYIFTVISDSTKEIQRLDGENKFTMKFTYYLTARDTVYIVVGRAITSSASKSITVHYSLTLQATSIKAFDKFESNDSREMATHLENNSTLASTLISTSDTDFYKLPATEGYIYTFDVSGDADINFQLTDFFDKLNMKNSSFSYPSTFIYHSAVNDTLYMKVFQPGSLSSNKSCGYRP